MSKVEVATFECDGCGQVENIPVTMKNKHKEVHKALGFHGTAEVVHEVGKTGKENWFACSVECIQGAVLNVTQQQSSESAQMG